MKSSNGEGEINAVYIMCGSHDEVSYLRVFMNVGWYSESVRIGEKPEPVRFEMLSTTINALKKIKSTQVHTQGINHSRSIPHKDFDNNIQKKQVRFICLFEQKTPFYNKKKKHKTKKKEKALIQVLMLPIGWL